MLGARAPGATRTSLGAHHRHLARGRAAIGSCDWATAASPAATTTSCQQRLGIITASSTTTQSHGRERAVHRAKHGLAGSSPFSTASSSSSPAARLVCASSLTSHLSSLSAASSAPARPRVAGSPRPGTRRSLHTSPLAAARAGWQHRASTSSDSGAKTLYDELGLGERAQKSEIKARFYELSRIYHPDAASSSGSSQLTTEQRASRFRRISEAYSTLSDPGARSTYDASLRGGSGGRGGAGAYTTSTSSSVRADPRHYPGAGGGYQGARSANEHRRERANYAWHHARRTGSRQHPGAHPGAASGAGTYGASHAAASDGTRASAAPGGASSSATGGAGAGGAAGDMGAGMDSAYDAYARREQHARARARGAASSPFHHHHHHHATGGASSGASGGAASARARASRHEGSSSSSSSSASYGEPLFSSSSNSSTGGGGGGGGVVDLGVHGEKESELINDSSAWRTGRVVLIFGSVLALSFVLSRRGGGGAKQDDSARRRRSTTATRASS